jgi:gliding motility-associated-like protein
VNPVPIVSFTPQNADICIGDSVTLVASSTIPGAGFLWSGGQTTPSITLHPNTNQTPSVTASLNGCSSQAQGSVQVFSNPLLTVSPVTPSLCSGDSIFLTVYSNLTGTHFQWNTGDTSQSILVNPVVTTSYSVTGSAGICQGDILVSVLVKPTPETSITPSDTTVCQGDSIVITAISDIPGTRFQWNFGDTLAQVFMQPFMSSYYYVYAEADGCRDTASAHILVKALPVFSLGEDGYYCEGEQLILKGPEGGYTYLWSDQTNLQTLAVTTPGIYWLMLRDGTCSYSDSIELKKCTEIWVPNAFTPNQDGKNDFFIPVYNDISEYELYIYNRWGGEVFHSNEPETGWDGTFKGQDASAGVYYYLILYKGYGNIQNGVRHQLQGVVTLVR